MLFTITTQDQFNDCLLWISDLYKDAYGFRNRCIRWENFSFEELSDEVNRLSAIVEEEVREAQEAEENLIQKVIAYGAGDRKTAERWIESAWWA